MNPYKTVLIGAAGVLASIPGLALFLSGTITPLGQRAILSTVVEIVGVASLLLTQQRKESIKRWSYKKMRWRVVAQIVAALLLLVTYMACYDFCIVKDQYGTQWELPFWLGKDANDMVGNGTRTQAVNTYRSQFQDALDSSPSWSWAITRSTFVVLACGFTMFSTVAFMILAVRATPESRAS